MSLTISATSSTSASASASATSNGVGIGSAQGSQGISLVAFVTALASSLTIFAVQISAFVLLKNRLARIFIPKTYLVPERERTEPPPSTPWGWFLAIFRFKDREVIKKCGLDAYFFLRYLRTLLVIFVPMAAVILPVLIPINQIHGKGREYALEFTSSSHPYGTSASPNVTGMDVLAWTNVRPENAHRYWAHLVMAILVIVWVCWVLFIELKVYVKVRQDYLTSAEHRLRASATTVLVSAIPEKWLNKEALGGLFDVFPGGIRNIWINRNFDDLTDKIVLRNFFFKKLESGETELIQKAKEAQKKKAESDEKHFASKLKGQKMTREKKLQIADADAQRLAKEDSGEGDSRQVPHTVGEAIEEEIYEQQEESSRNTKYKASIVGKGLTVVGQGLGKGLGKGLGLTRKVGSTVVGGAKNVGKTINNELETKNGFVNIDMPPTPEDRHERIGEAFDQAGIEQNEAQKSPFHHKPKLSGDSNGIQTAVYGNTVRKVVSLDGVDEMSYDSWWKFWKPPAGGFASPIPVGYEGRADVPPTQGNEVDAKLLAKGKESFRSGVANKFLFASGSSKTYKEYKSNEDGGDDDAVWKKYLKKEDRPTFTIPIFSWTPSWFPGLPFVNKNVDTIYFCRRELARLNREIEEDQLHPERFPIMNSAFIQFNNQVAAHMACQAVAYHIPRHMAPRIVEISPEDVIWDNMSLKWWNLWLRKGVAIVIVSGMVVLWAIPVGWTSTLANITAITHKYHWLAWLQQIPKTLLEAIAGVIPAVVLAFLLWIVPELLGYLATWQGSRTGTEREGAIQSFYFAFLFVQVFLVVSVSAGAIEALGSTSATVTSIPETLASQLPKASNYFFSYMILQALSTSSGTILQIVTLLKWFTLPPFLDKTAREKWRRNTKLPRVQWGTYFPVYTNFACIGLIYSVISPLIIVFAIITFSLLWIANRYNMLYVTRFRIDTGGLLYPQAINQTFTGLYVMELCLIGLFFITHNEAGEALIAQAIIMIVALFLTILFQVLLNISFAPLLRYLPITFEDEAVLRDQAFERAQARRLGFEDEDLQDEASGLTSGNPVSMSDLGKAQDEKQSEQKTGQVRKLGTWAVQAGKTVTSKTFNREQARRRRRRDLDANNQMRDALFGQYNDELEDLDPEERNTLVQHAFKHAALRTRKPILWIPKDDIGVAQDEILRTKLYAGNDILIDNRGAALDGKCKVVYGKSPPDFSEIDIITL